MSPVVVLGSWMSSLRGILLLTRQHCCWSRYWYFGEAPRWMAARRGCLGCRGRSSGRSSWGPSKSLEGPRSRRFACIFLLGHLGRRDRCWSSGRLGLGLGGEDVSRSIDGGFRVGIVGCVEGIFLGGGGSGEPGEYKEGKRRGGGHNHCIPPRH